MELHSNVLCIIIDYEMPVMNGVEAAFKIRYLEETYNWKKCYIIGASGDDTKKDSCFNQNSIIVISYKTHQKRNPLANNWRTDSKLQLKNKGSIKYYLFYIYYAPNKCPCTCTCFKEILRAIFIRLCEHSHPIFETSNIVGLWYGSFISVFFMKSIPSLVTLFHDWALNMTGLYIICLISSLSSLESNGKVPDSKAKVITPRLHTST